MKRLVIHESCAGHGWPVVATTTWGYNDVVKFRLLCDGIGSGYPNCVMTFREFIHR